MGWSCLAAGPQRPEQASRLVCHDPAARRPRSASWSRAALFAFFVANLSAEDFFDWGWRYPFFVAFAINVVALFARLRMVVTPQYTKLFESQELQPTTVCGHGAARVATSFSEPSRRSRASHCSTWSPCFRCPGCSCSRDQMPSRFLVIEMIGARRSAFVAIVVSGLLADRVGRRNASRGDRGRHCRVQRLLRPNFSMAAPSARPCSWCSASSCWAFPSASRPGAVASNFSKKYPLHRLGPDLRSRLAVRCRVSRRSSALLLSSQFRADLRRRLPLSGAVCTLLALWISGQLKPLGANE